MRVQELLRESIVQAYATGNAASQLCLLEPWVLWLTRISELEDTIYDFRDPDLQLQEWQRKCSPYGPPLLDLAHSLLACMTLDPVRPPCMYVP